MPSYKFLIAFCLILPFQTWTMNRFSGNFRSNSTSSSFFKRPFQLTYEPFAFKSFMKAGVLYSRNSSFFTPHFRTHKQIRTHISKRSFSSSQSVFGMWNDFTWKFKSAEKKKEELFGGLKDKLQSSFQKNQHKSKFFPEMSIEELIQKIQSEGFINETLAGSINYHKSTIFGESDNIMNYDWTPLKIVVFNSYWTPKEKLENIISILKNTNANFHDIEALKLAIKKSRSKVLTLIQHHFTLMELFPEYIEAKCELRKIKNSYFLDMSRMSELEQILTALNQPLKKQKFTSKIFEGHEETLEASTCEEVYNRHKEHYDAYYSKQSKYNTDNYNDWFNAYNNWSENNNNYFKNEQNNNYYESSQAQNDIPYDAAKYPNPLDHELYKTFIQANKKNIQLKEIFNLTQATTNNEIKAAYMKLVHKFHPDRFNHDQELHKMATEVTKRLNQMKRINEF